jgi:hypothetical protein
MAPVVLAETPTRLAEKLDGLPERMRTLAQLAITGTPEEVTQTYESLMLGGIDYLLPRSLAMTLRPWTCWRTGCGLLSKTWRRALR